MSFLDLTGVEMEKNDFKPIPEGDYDLACIEAKLEDTKAKDGKYIKAKFKIVGGDFDGRFIFHNFNIENKNPKAVSIAQQELLKFLTSAGLPKAKMILQNPSELCGLVGKAKLKHEEHNGKINSKIHYWILPEDLEKPSSKSSYASELGF